MSRPSLLIPVRGSDENVEVFVDELPEDADDILAILQAEIAPLDIWLKFAVEYYRQGKIESFLKILNEGTDPGLEEYYSDSKAERIALLNALASYYTQLASREKKDKQKRDEYFGQATASFNKADKIDAFEFLTWVGKGVLFLCKGDLDRATYNFDTVLQTNPDNIPALMGKACVQYNKGQYQEALVTYKSILSKNPNCPAAIRLGLAFCFYKLGRTDLAKQAFDRVLQLDPNNVEALVGLAVFELNTEKQGSITSAMQMLKKAFSANGTNSMVLNHFANHFFYKKDYQKVNTLALQAYHNTEVPQAKGFSCYLLAKAFHANEDFEQAYNYYAQALRHWPAFDLAQFGVAQMLLQKGQSDQAITYFESVLTSHPDNFETLKILGSLYAQAKNTKDKAKGYLKKATDLNSGDYEAWIELAHLTELTDFPGALAAYEKARQLLQKRREKVSAELWNNLAVLRHKLGQLKGAEEAYKGALIASGNVTEAGDYTTEVKAQTVTMLYNLARLYEDMHEPAKAEELYLSIVREHPNYIDCYMRLGCIERDRKQYKAASTWFEECLIIHHEHPDTWALIGNMHLGKEEWQQAQKKFEKIIEKDRADPYSLLSLGNIYYNAKFHTAEKEAKYVRLAYEFYWKVLQKNPANLYAANGMGIVVAERGEIGLAKEFFTQVSESSETMADARLNLAHIHFAQGMFINAVKLYQNCLKKYYENKDPEVLLCLARAYFEWNKMEECKQTLQKAIHIDPTNQLLWYNLAITQHKNATMLLQKSQRRTLQDMQVATTDLTQAISTFTVLSHPRSAVKPAYSVSKAQRYVKLCTQLKQDANTQYEEAQRADAEQAKRRADQIQRQEEADRTAREQRAQEEADAEVKKAEQERVLQEIVEHQKRVIEKYTNPEPVPEEEGGEKRKKKKKTKSKKKGKKGAEENEEMQDEDGTQDGEDTVQKKRRRNTEEDGERQEKRKSKKKSKRIVESDEDGETNEGVGEENAGEDATGEEGTEEATGEEATGEEATGEEATGEEATGEEATGEEATGEEATGEEATGEEAAGEEATGEEVVYQEETGEGVGGEEAGVEGTEQTEMEVDPNALEAEPTEGEMEPSQNGGGDEQATQLDADMAPTQVD